MTGALSRGRVLEFAALPEDESVIDIASDGAATVRVEKLAQVGGRTFFRVSTDRAAFKFYVTRQGLIRGLDYA